MSSVVEVSNPSVEPVDLATAKRFLRLPASAAPDDDDITNIFIPGARVYVEKATELVLANRNFIQYEDHFPGHRGLFGSDPAFALSFLFGYGAIGYSPFGPHGRKGNQKRLLRSPVTAVSKISYIDSTGNPQDLATGTDFAVDFSSIPGRISPLPGGRWPAATLGGLNNVRIFYSAGYMPLGADEEDVTLSSNTPPQEFTDIDFEIAIPLHLYTAILQIIVHWYQNRDLIITTAGAGGTHTPIPHQFDAIVNLERVYDFSSPDY